MIHVNSSKDIIKCYLLEAYRRAYSNSIDKFGNIGDYDVLYNQNKKDNRGRIIIPFDDYYCPDKIQIEILDTLKKEPYVIRNYKTKHHLSTFDKQVLVNSFNLGCSPCSKFKYFKRIHPDIQIDLEINEEDE